jgi:hypothetical protein
LPQRLFTGVSDLIDAPAATALWLVLAGYQAKAFELAETGIEMADHLRFSPDGKIRELTVFFRPLPAATAALSLIAAGLGRRKSPVRAAVMSALTRPLAYLTRAGDGIGVRLVRSCL